MTVEVSIKNYEAIPDLSLTIQGFTGLTGLSNAGKSVFIRAIKSAIYNDSTERCINWGASEARVVVKFLAPHPPLSIEWTRFRQTSEVKINDDLPLRKLNGKTPQPIVDYGFRLIGKKSPNFHLLEDSFFLIHESESIVTDVFQEVLHFAKISDALDLCNTEKKKAISKLTLRREDLSQATEAAKITGQLDEAEQRIEELLLSLQLLTSKKQEQELLLAKEISLEANKNLLIQFSNVVKKIKSILKTMSSLISLQQELQVIDLGNKVCTVKQVISKIKNLVEVQSVTEKNLLKSTLERCAIGYQMSVKAIESLTTVGRKAATALANFSVMINTIDKAVVLSDVRTRLVNTATSFKETTGKRNKIVEEFHEVDALLKKVTLCPLCSNPFHDQQEKM